MNRIILCAGSLLFTVLLTSSVHSQTVHDSINKLEQIRIALMKYHGDRNAFPVADRFDPQSQNTCLSWRVTLLPYLGQEKLFAEFKLNEPWDSSHNKAVYDKYPMPGCYLTVGNESEKNKTTYFQGFVCEKDSKPGSFFAFGIGRSIKDITDGEFKTLAVVESGPAVPWTKPDDIPFDPAKPIPKLISPTGAKFAYGILVDGAVGKIDIENSDKWIRSMVTINGAEDSPLVGFNRVQTAQEAINAAKNTPEMSRPREGQVSTKKEVQFWMSMHYFFIGLAIAAPVIVLVPFAIYWYVKKAKTPPKKKKKKISKLKTRE